MSIPADFQRQLDRINDSINALKNIPAKKRHYFSRNYFSIHYFSVHYFK